MPSRARRAPARRRGVFRDRRPRYLPRDDRGRRRSSAGGIILPLLLLLVIGGLLWFFLTRGDDDTATTDATGPGATGQGTGQIIVGAGDDLLAACGDAESFGTYEGQTVTGTDVEVLAVVGDEGFWAGTDDANRVFVQIDTTAESSVTVDPGDRVTFSGTVEVLPIDFEQRFGLSSDEGLEQLRTQGHYVSATQLSESTAAG